MNYWDTSAILKLYVPETDSARFLELLASTNEPIGSSAVAGIEVLCALHRKEAVGDLTTGAASRIYQRFLADCGAGRIVRIPYGDDVVSRAAEVVRLALQRPHPVMIRSLDAIHIASALVAKSKKLVATDLRLRAVASRMSLVLEP